MAVPMGRQPLFLDTDEKTEQVLLELVRDMPDWKKLEQVASLTKTVRELALIGLKDQYPNASENELWLRFASLVLGHEVAERAFAGRFGTEPSR